MHPGVCEGGLEGGWEGGLEGSFEVICRDYQDFSGGRFAKRIWCLEGGLEAGCE